MAELYLQCPLTTKNRQDATGLAKSLVSPSGAGNPRLSSLVFLSPSDEGFREIGRRPVGERRLIRDSYHPKGAE